MLASGLISAGMNWWQALLTILVGNTIVLLPKFSAETAWALVEKEGVNASIITGDAMARPMIEHLDEDPERYDTSSVISLSSILSLPLMSRMTVGTAPVAVSMTPLPLRSIKPSARILINTGRLFSKKRFST